MARAATIELHEKILAALKASKKGMTSEELGKALDMAERQARRHLATLFSDQRVTREGEYEGDPLVFHYRYKVAKPGAK